MAELSNNLPDEWLQASNENKERLQRELRTEMLTGHVLYDRDIEVVAHRDDTTDDILVCHKDNTSRYTVVHLTWRMAPELNTQYPTIESYSTFDDFLQYETSFHYR